MDFPGPMKRRPFKFLPQLTPVAFGLLAALPCASVWAANGGEAARLDTTGLSVGLFAVLALVWTLGLYLQSTRRRMV